MQPGQLIQLRNIFFALNKKMFVQLTANMGLGGHNVPFLVQKGKLRKMTERECLRCRAFRNILNSPN